jgi:flavin reductase (DIM6/NTAB) family NADH-FMN oxidoreductase RutF
MDRAAAAALFAMLDREVWLVTAAAGERRGGLIATFVSQASLSPEHPRVVVGIARQHHTWELIEASGAFALHLLAVENAEWVAHFGVRSGRDEDKFAGRNVGRAATGSPILEGSMGWLDCSVEARLETGDRTLYLAQVLEGKVTRGGAPLRARQLGQHLGAEVLAQLKELVQKDSEVDAVAIRAWREQRGISH